MIIDGRKLADEILANLKKEIKKLPRLTVGAVLVGSSAASISFLRQKEKFAKSLGIRFKVFNFSQKITTEKLVREIKKLNELKTINGIIVQLPLPKHIKVGEVLNAINPQKDMDSLSKTPKVLAPTVEAVKFIFKKYKISYKNKNILIVGRGRLVGQPIYNWLTAQESSRYLMRSKEKIIKTIDIRQTSQLPNLTKKADIIISGVGKAGLIKGPTIKKDAVLIDFGFDRKNKKISGDFEFESCAKKAKLITPVPGGMGPIMTVMLFRNLLKLNKKSPR